MSALIARHRQSHGRIIALLSPKRSDWFQPESWWLLAEAFAGAGQPDSAAAYLERLTASRGIMSEGNHLQVGLFYSIAHFHLGRLYTQLGRPNKARGHYTAFLETFTHPDPKYAWMVTEAQARLEELARER